MCRHGVPWPQTRSVVTPSLVRAGRTKIDRLPSPGFKATGDLQPTTLFVSVRLRQACQGRSEMDQTNCPARYPNTGNHASLHAGSWAETPVHCPAIPRWSAAAAPAVGTSCIPWATGNLCADCIPHTRSPRFPTWCGRLGCAGSRGRRLSPASAAARRNTGNGRHRAETR